jgi:putative tricarboxylic transport membrane protein
MTSHRRGKHSDRPGHEPHHSVREQLVGDEDARVLGVSDDERTAPATMALGALLLVMGLLAVVDAWRLPDSDDTVGPAAAPMLVGVLLLVVGGGLLVQGRRHMGAWEYSDHPTRSQLLRLLAVLGALLVFALLVPFAGYVVSSTFLFASTAILLGSPHRLRAVAYGWIVAAAVFLVFDEMIGLTLSAGPWGF